MPLLMLSRRTLDTKGQVTEFVRSLYRGDRYRFQTGLQRPRQGISAQVKSSDDVMLRKAHESDARALASVFIEAWRDGYRGVVDDAIIDALNHTEVASWLADVVKDTSATTLVAERSGGEVVGFARFGDDPEDPSNGHLFALYVAPHAARKGVGRLLLERVISDLDPGSGRNITLWVFEANERAQRLYGAAGFEVGARRRVEEEYRAQEIQMCRANPASDEPERKCYSHCGCARLMGGVASPHVVVDYTGASPRIPATVRDRLTAELLATIDTSFPSGFNLAVVDKTETLLRAWGGYANRVAPVL